ncbi:MAG: apolipoprotein N-acyltransferase, partial [Syntrophales bacterium]|nr:apolipoprotein N-acyltransferase [Syntrophales bacterium]
MIDRRTLFLSLLSGVLLICSFPKFGFGVMAWVSLVPLIFAVEGKDVRTGFLSGFIAGMVAYTGIMYWIAYVVVTYGYLPWAVGVGAMFLLAAYLSLYLGVFAGGVVFFAGRDVPVSVVAPPLWVALEYVRSHVLTGFPWENVGYSQYAYLPIIQIADVTGVYGVSFLIVLVNALLFEIFCLWRAQEAKAAAVRVAVGVVIMLAVWAYGTWRIAQWYGGEQRHPVLETVLVQGNVDQSVKWNPLYQAETMAAYTSVSRQAAPQPPGLIIWPETAVPSFFQDRDDIHRQIVSLAGETRSWFLFGSPSYRFVDGHLT